MKRLVAILTVGFVLANLLAVFFPQTIGMDTTPSWTSSGDDDQAFAFYGHSVSSAGDVNGDGYDDVIIGAYGAGKAYLYFGSESGLSSTPSWSYSGGSSYGYSVASAGDVNDDGYDDVIVSACYYDTANTNAGKAYLYLGSASGLSTTPSWTSSGDDQVYAYYGCSVSSAGDVNGDGYDDVIIGAPFHDTENNDAGKAYLYLGSASGLSTTPSWTSSGDDQPITYYGCSVSSAGDVNGDGYSDVIIGASYYDTASYEAGKAYLYFGNSSGLEASPSWTSSGDDQKNAQFGRSVASAGDVNGDGYDDVIIGAPYYDTTNFAAGKVYLYLGSATGLSTTPSWTSSGDDQVDAYFGFSISSAGDVNGDGYDDVIIGAHAYLTTKMNAGKAYLYLGSTTSLSTTPFWTSSGDNQKGAHYGYSVSSAGDTNGDKVDDSVVGAPYYDTLTSNGDAGKAYLYLGVNTPPATPTGLAVTDVPNDEGGALNITWDANTEIDLDHYTLYSNKTGSWTIVAEISAGTEYYVDTGLTDGTRYYYNISASDNASNESPQSATASGIPTDNLPPATPTGLTAQDHPNDEGSAIDLEWNDNAEPDLDHYNIYRSTTQGGPYTEIGETTTSDYTDTTTTDGVTYYYVVTASDEIPNESGYSNEASAKSLDNLPPATPTGLAVTSLRNGGLNITWNLNTDDTHTYSIHSNKTGTWALLVNVTHSQYWYIDTGLTSGTTYYYKISAWDEIPLESLESGVVHGVSSPIGTISGIVTDKDSNLIEGANIVIYVAGTTTNPITSTTTNSNGEYSVDVPPGTYDVKVEKSGYDTQWEKDVEVTADQTTTINLTLPTTTNILSDYWWLILPIIIIVVIIIIALITKKKKSPEAEEVEQTEVEEKAEAESGQVSNENMKESER